MNARGSSFLPCKRYRREKKREGESEGKTKNQLARSSSLLSFPGIKGPASLAVRPHSGLNHRRVGGRVTVLGSENRTCEESLMCQAAAEGNVSRKSVGSGRVEMARARGPTSAGLVLMLAAALVMAAGSQPAAAASVGAASGQETGYGMQVL